MEPQTSPDAGNGSLWVRADDVTLHAREYGDSSSEVGTVLLLCAADQTSERWPTTFVDALVDAGLAVLVFDHRDSGRSTKIAPDRGYRLDDLVDDCVAVLDAVGLERVHVFGRSMGGMVAQLLAIEHPSRVRSLTLLSTTPGPETAGLSRPREDLVAALAERLFDGPPPEGEERLRWVVEGQRLFCGSGFEFDEVRELQLARLDAASGHPVESGHGAAVYSTTPWGDRLEAWSVPVRVVHGDEDPVYGLDHARALAEATNGELVVLEGLGHDFPARIGRRIADEVIENVRSEKRARGS